jgi:hypothetical protein
VGKRARTLFRVAAVLFLLFAAGHTAGFLTFRPTAADAIAVLDGMNRMHFDFGGASGSWMGFYTGFGSCVSVYLVFSALLAWRLGSAREVEANMVRTFGWMLCARGFAISWQQQESGRQRTRETMQEFVPRLQRWFAGPAVVYSVDAATALRNRGKPASATLNPHPGLALCIPQVGGWRITVVPLEPPVRSLHVNLPNYLGAWLNVEGERWNVGERMNPKLTPLAYAKGSGFRCSGSSSQPQRRHCLGSGVCGTLTAIRRASTK